jgi:hypothetical protein
MQRYRKRGACGQVEGLNNIRVDAGLLVVTSTGISFVVASARVKKHRVARPSRRGDTYTSMTCRGRTSAPPNV